MSDEYFEYLPFKSALSRAAMTGDEPCEATSKSEFPQFVSLKAVKNYSYVGFYNKLQYYIACTYID